MKKVLQVFIDVLCGSLTVAAALALSISAHTIHNIPIALFLFELIVIVAALLRVWPMRQASASVSWRVGLGASLPLLLIGIFALQALKNPILWSAVVGVGIAVGLTVLAVALLKQRKLVSASVTFLVVAVWYFGAFHAINREGEKTDHATLINEPTPAVQLVLSDGTHVSPGVKSDHVTVLDFWGTWCAACLEEMPVMEEVHDHYSKDLKVRFYAVNPGWAGDTDQAKVQRFLQRRPISLPLAFSDEKSVHQFGGIALPLVVVIDREGRERFRSTGFSDAQAFANQLVSTIETLKGSGSAS